MYLYIKKRSGEVAMRSETKIKHDPSILEEILYEPRQQDRQKVERNLFERYENGQVIFKEAVSPYRHNRLVREAKIEEIKVAIEKPDMDQEKLIQIVRDLCNLI